MSPNSPAETKFHELHRKIITAYWVVFFISIVAEINALFIIIKTQPNDLHSYLMNTMLVPTIVQTAIMVANEVMHKLNKEQPYIILLSGTCIATVLLIANKTIHIQFIFLLPMLVSLFYYNVRKLIAAFIMNIAAFSIVFALYPQIRNSISQFELFAFIFIMLGTLYILRGLIRRGKQILDDLTRTLKSEQELLVKNILMDRLIKMDALTEMYNHKTFHQYLDLLIEQSNNNSLSFQLAIIDIDNFKKINDTFGHAVGDAILRRVAKTLKESLTDNEIVARYGGEEFAVIFPGKSLDEAFREIEEARLRIWQIRHEEMDGGQVSISIGLAEYRRKSGKSAVFGEVDNLLYTAKRSGKNKTVTPAYESSEAESS
jgi:diguanylate cyclase (GGDEF)-like protein